jgi:hypothetical protein
MRKTVKAEKENRKEQERHRKQGKRNEKYQIVKWERRKMRQGVPPISIWPYESYLSKLVTRSVCFLSVASIDCDTSEGEGFVIECVFTAGFWQTAQETFRIKPSDFFHLILAVFAVDNPKSNFHPVNPTSAMERSFQTNCLQTGSKC